LSGVPYVDLAAQAAPLRDQLLEAVGRVLDHGQFILGPEVGELERRLSGALDGRPVVGVNSGTDALLLALRLRGVGPGHEVITASHSFFATASAIDLVGATPVFVDVDERTMQIDPQRVAEAIGPRTKAILAVHLNGFACAVEELDELARAHGLELIEDCAQSLFVRRRGRPVGTFGTGCFSLHPLKVLSACGDAGFVAVDSEQDADRLRRMRNLGLRDRDHLAEISGNSRLDTLQAAMLLVKLEHVGGWIAQRRAHAAAYRAALAGRVTLPPEEEGDDVVYSAFVVRHPERDRLRAELAARGVDAKIHYPVPIHLQEPYRDRPPRYPLPVTERVCARILSLPVTPELTAEGREKVVAAVVEATGTMEGDRG